MVEINDWVKVVVHRKVYEGKVVDKRQADGLTLCRVTNGPMDPIEAEWEIWVDEEALYKM